MGAGGVRLTKTARVFNVLGVRSELSAPPSVEKDTLEGRLRPEDLGHVEEDQNHSLGLGAAVVVVGALTAFIRGRDKDLPRVTTAKVEKMDLVSKVTANGKIQAKNKVDMSALVMGQIVNLAVKEGDHVKKGQLLLQIDRVQLAAQAQGREASLAAMRHDLDAAKANAVQAKIDYERAKQNFDGARSWPRPTTRRPSRAWTPRRRRSPPPSSA